ncbi:MAG: hypothetical protein K0U68_04405 [Gammaproteobacteria bacterium]|nr:hypothetical protein [Gammaproteobacteria bacterium]
MHKRLIYILCVTGLALSPITQCYGNETNQLPLYWELVMQAQPDAEALAESETLIKDHTEVDIIERTRIRPFHKQPKYTETSSQAFCMNCHLPIPHTKNLRNRSFLNMHTTYIACETCHFRPENITLDYQWFDYKTRQLQTGSESLFKVIKPKTAEQKQADKPRNTDLKISPFYQHQPVFLFKDSEQPKQLLKQWESGDLPQRVMARAKIHAPLQTEGPECKACHDPDHQQLDLQQLGATRRQFKAITMHRIPLFFSRYKEDDQKIRIIDVLR